MFCLPPDDHLDGGHFLLDCSDLFPQSLILSGCFRGAPWAVSRNARPSRNINDHRIAAIRPNITGEEEKALARRAVNQMSRPTGNGLRRGL